MQSNWVDFKAIKAAVSMAAVLERYQVRGLKKQGDELRGRCPIHNGEGDAFHVNVNKNAFQCFSCQAKGNVLDFVAAMEKCSVRDAGLKLQDWFGLAAGDGADQRSAKPAPPADSTELAKERIAGEESLANKPLGFDLRGIDHGHAYLTSRGISRETAEHFGAGYFSGKGSMSGRVVIPIHNEAGELVAYAGRSIDGSEPRYKLPTGFHKSLELYNQHRAAKCGAGGLIVVEGFFDAMKVSQAGYPFVVALMGCTMSEEQERLLVAHADMVLVMLDADEAGRKGTEELLLRLGRRVWVKAITVPEGKQPDQLTAEELQQLLKK
jgi:DNA primase